MESITKKGAWWLTALSIQSIDWRLAHQYITEILKGTLPQVEMLHPPFWYQRGHKQWPNPGYISVTNSDQIHLQATAQLDSIQYAEPVKIEARYKTVAMWQKGLKMLLH